MPIYKSYSPNSSTIIKVWKIQESYNELISSISLSKLTLEKLKNTNSEIKRCEILSVRHLIIALGYSDNDLYYNKLGKPVLKGIKNISITHSKLFSAVIISDFKVSIDVENIRDKIINISEKFIDYEYSYLADLNFEKERLTFIWSIKECIYKISEQKLPYIFKEKCIVLPFSKNDDSVVSWLNFKGLITCFNSYLYSFEGYNLVYLINEN
jgi:4'-phosphopantetheinyl transferase